MELEFFDALHAGQLATRGDLAELGNGLHGDLANAKLDVIRWVAGMLLAQTAFIVTAVGVLGRFMPH